MLLFYVRHGDPIYNPNSLTPLGERQAEAVAKRLALYGIDKVYSSPSNRAVQTSRPTCEILKKTPQILDYADEEIAWSNLTYKWEDGRKSWLFHYTPTRLLINSPEIRDLGDRWFDHPAFKDYKYKEEIERIYSGTDSFLASLGYEHERYTGRYKAVSPTDERVALFAHQGFGLAFLSCLLDIPYPQFCTHFDITHTGMTVIEFKEENGYSIPKVCTHSSDSHLYREGLPTNYNNILRF